MGVIVPADVSGAFVVRNRTGLFAGDLASLLDRRMYLFGTHEEEAIAAFLALVPPGRRGVALDIGANVGTHSLAFASQFREVHAFEPNPHLWQAFERNIRLNDLTNVHLHRIGLADVESKRPFFNIAKNNHGLGTFSTVEQYDLPMHQLATLDVAQGDRYLAAAGIGRVDAIKIDVQGLELEVLTGLAEVLARDKPTVWFELGVGTAKGSSTFAPVRRLLRFEADLYRFETTPSGIFHSARLLPAEESPPTAADYFAVASGTGQDAVRGLAGRRPT